MTAVTTKQPAANTQPFRKACSASAGDGVPMMTTSRAMPSTPPSCRTLALTADAVA